MTEREDGRIEVRIIPGMGEVSVKTAEFDPNSPILSRLNRTGQPVSQYEIDILPEFRASPPWERAWLEELNMELYVPIRRQSLLVGILALGGKAGEAPYSDQDLDVLSTLAGQTAVALQNARLVSDLKALNADITNLNDELTRTNRRLEKLDEAKTNFIQIASHELRTPLTQVRGYADIMADVVQADVPSPAQLAQVSQGISRATVRLEEIISAMLDVSQIDVESLSLNRTSLAMTSVMRIALDGCRDALQQRKQTLTLEGIEGLPPIQGDLQRLCQAFGNIVGNCIKYTPDGGRITINGRHLQEAGAGGMPITYVEITIADTGIGIDAEDRELIFEKFYRVGSPDLHSTGSTKFKGAGPGLGLPITRGVIKAHGGRVWVESPGHDEVNFPGSTFHVVLPATPPAPPAGVIAASAVATALAA
jgi:signal transduction histidine kinase